ncbi:MAG: hypothetical protein JWR33_2023 [Naasia sp.]|uniref:DUF3046 domain-containing protein n=1 Tax=Naasia sp. TaxID=2546198 RepID=UPI0026042BB6|nr:DUF3046 domain-containing protein [Naasia sp.]MCU1571282.1 hypothetical protein [Naasia sp.]
MRLSEFRFAVGEEFGDAYGRALAREFVLDELGGLTADQALAAGRTPGDVWAALCRATDVPRERWHGRGRPAR